MARIENGNFSGAIGNVVFYTMNGKTYARSRPSTPKKKKNTPEKPSVTAFKTASKYGTRVLQQLKPFIPFPVKLVHYNRFRGWLLSTNYAWQSDNNTNPVCLHNINPLCSLRDYWLLMPEVHIGNQGVVSISLPNLVPQQHIIAPAKTASIRVDFVTLANSMSDAQQVLLPQISSLSIPYNATVLPAQTLQLYTEAQAKDWVFVLMCVQYLQNTALQSLTPAIQPEWMPAAIVAVRKCE